MSRPRGFNNGTKRYKAKRELQRGECKIRPAPFLSGQRLGESFWQYSGSFGPTLRYEDLEIHKVFLRSSTLICAKISRSPIDNLFHRLRL